MKTYLVGGAVRDKLLGLPVMDRDWVVVGSTPETMAEAGFKSVGKDFPVFLHPTTHEEYALARLERKTGPGYHGFAFDAGKSVTLEDDLSRRDLTINAIAETEDGDLIDPHGGKQDLNNRVLRHVSDAFVEDPVRVLRVARFMARLIHHGFSVAEETMSLMRAMVSNGEIDNLVAERVWQEMHGALGTTTPRAFFDTLLACGALQVLLPEVAALDGIPQPEQWHPEIDTYIHTMMVIEQCVKLEGDAACCFAALCHDLGKATTPEAILPSHHGHEDRGARITEELCQRLRVPGKFRELAVMTARYHTHCHRARESKATTLVKTLKSLDVIRKPDRFMQYLKVCEADKRGRAGLELRDYPEAAFMAEAADTIRAVDSGAIARQTSNKGSVAQVIRQAEVNSLKLWLKRCT